MLGKKAISKRFHYNNSSRIAPVVCLADEGWISIRAAPVTKRSEKARDFRTTARRVRLRQSTGIDVLVYQHGGAFKKKKKGRRAVWKNVEILQSDV